MQIAILAHNLRVAGGRSVGQNVIAALGRVADQHEYLMFLPAGVGYEELSKPSRAVVHYLSFPHGPLSQLRFERFSLPRLVRAFRPDVVWGLGNFGLGRPAARQAVLIHKPHLIYEKKYQLGQTPWLRLTNWMIRRRLAASLPATQLVFCQTEAAAQRFRRFFSYRGQIAIMPNAVSEALRRGSPDVRPAVFQQLRCPHVLFCLTRYYPHKNLEILVEVFRRYREQLRDVAILFTVSPDDDRAAARFLRRLREPHLREHLVNVGPLPQQELPAYYAASTALILPTVLESFSGTYLEAMEFERPILTSDMDFARVVCADAARYFDPFDPASIRDAIRELIDSATLRQQLIEAGRQRRQTFVRNWNSIVAEAVARLEKLV